MFDVDQANVTRRMMAARQIIDAGDGPRRALSRSKSVYKMTLIAGRNDTYTRLGTPEAFCYAS